MKNHVRVFVLVTLLLSVAEIFAAHYLAAHDTVALLVALKPVAILAALLAMSARMCRYLILPGWGLYLALTWAWTRFRRAPAEQIADQGKGQ